VETEKCKKKLTDKTNTPTLAMQHQAYRNWKNCSAKGTVTQQFFLFKISTSSEDNFITLFIGADMVNNCSCITTNLMQSHRQAST